MQLKNIRIKNFRAIEDLQINLTPQTAILGGNGCGKSTVLRAMEKFFGQQTRMEADDFFARDMNREIEIELTFNKFNATEHELFNSRINNSEMTVTRVFDSGGGRSNGRYYGSTAKHLGFDAIRAIEGARERRNAYNEIRANTGDYAGLPAIQREGQIAEGLEQWERENPTQCVMGRDDGQFFGFTNVAKGALQKATTFVFVPAVRDASIDSMDAKGAVISKLMELVVRSAIQKRKDIRDFQEKVSAEYRNITNPGQLPELGGLADVLSETLKIFYNEAGVSLEWKPAEDFIIPLPAAEVFLDDDGFKGPVDRKGHGLQRAFIVTLLQHLARASLQAAEQAETQIVELPASESGGQQGSPPLQELLVDMPGLILAIEEPELYQHPTKQRHFAKVLSELSSGLIPGVATSTQVIFASHSSLFVSMDRFEQIRIARRKHSAGSNVKTCEVNSAMLEAVVEKLELAHSVEKGTYTAETLSSRLHILGPELAEGFFANLVVLVEGISDRAALLAMASIKGVDFESRGIAVLPVDGKANLDRPTLIFAEFGIPVYVLWDCDSSKGPGDDRNAAIKMNRAIQRLCGVEEENIADFISNVSDRYACFDDKLETTLKSDIGDARFLAYVELVKLKYGITRNKDALKTPVVVADILQHAESDGLGSEFLGNVVDAIVKMRN